jgi:hypothetical protein
MQVRRDVAGAAIGAGYGLERPVKCAAGFGDRKVN